MIETITKFLLLWNMLKNYSAFLINRLVSLISLYGESIGRILLTAFFVIFAFGGTYSMMGAVISPNMAHPTHNFLTSLYFSIVTFTTLGYGDLHPINNTMLRLAAGSEAFLGVFLLAYFVVVVSRKIMR